MVERAWTKDETPNVPKVPVVQVPLETAAMLLLHHAKVTEEATILANPAPVEKVASFTNT